MTTSYWVTNNATRYMIAPPSSIGPPPESPFSCTRSCVGCMYVADTILSTMDRKGAAAEESGCVSKNPSPRSHDASMFGSMGSLPRKGTAKDAAIASGPEHRGHTYIHIYMHAYIHNAYDILYVYKSPLMFIRLCWHQLAYIHTYIHTYMHACMHTVHNVNVRKSLRIYIHIRHIYIHT
jgi:hypothetical protein